MHRYFFIDCMSIKICHNKRAKINKVFKRLAR
ncbi:transposase [Trichodesmium erythraeum]